MSMIASVHFAVGERVVLQERLKALVQMGYKRQDEVSDPATFANRGGILDVFPWGFSSPVRVEFFDDQVDSIFSYDLSSGLRLETHQMVVVLPSSSRISPKRLKRIDWNWGQTPIQPFVDIESGDHVVHVEYGIGIFKGTKLMDVPGHKDRMHLIIQYADKEILYVPMDDLNLVQRYVCPGMSKHHIKLSKLGTRMWKAMREKAKQGILTYANELLRLQARREALQGFACTVESEWEQDLKDDFPFKETPDQEKAIRETLEDLKKPKPMDRLICGDVGYGKTEIAVRAIFKMIMNGRQVAVIVPTTLLAEQHYETFVERFRNFPVKTAMLSRFQTKKEQRMILEAMKAGECDLVIGTHRLFSSDIEFKNLGLIVIDEEQRFGVKHKEKLKKLRLLVDVLTLSATPIPRTLYLSLVGGRDISLVSTPPPNRVPVVIKVCAYEPQLVKEVIQKELSRTGQVFYLYNRVQGIEKIAGRIADLVPEARIGVAHGQMGTKQLEKIMHEFMHGNIDVLVSTTIIESGIDIPNANTMIIERADHFGLSELYQLKGRVGRAGREAYAYLLVPKSASLTHDSQRRLQAIERHAHLGAGFNIAMEDLEIRGSGNILGTQQSGFVMSIGFDLYCRLLKDAIDSLKNNGEISEEANAVSADDGASSDGQSE